MKRLAIAILALSLIESTSEGQQPAASGVGGVPRAFGLHQLVRPTAAPVDTVYSEADVQEKPERLASPAPVYPPHLREAGIEGEVILEAIIDTLGHVEPNSLRVVQTSNPGFNESAKQFFLHSPFRPGRMHGQAVRVLLRLPVTFKVKGH